MTEVFARLSPGATLDAARSELRTRYAAITASYPEVYKPADHYRIDVTRIHDQINSSANTVFVGAVCGLGAAVCDRMLECN